MIKDYFKLKTWIILSFILFTGFSFSAIIVAVEIWRGLNLSDVNVAEAKKFEPETMAGDNLSGFAWSSNIGWISFNATDCDADCAGPTCTSEGSPPDCPAAGTSYADYGVRVGLATANRGVFSGYAWSSNVGWISFQEAVSGVPDNSFLGKCGVGGTCASFTGCTACYNFSDQKIYGWAKILSLGNDGWIRLDDNNIADSVIYGLSLDPGASEISGWAWNNNSTGAGIGWISFNCINEGTCGTINYKVSGNVNRPPEIVAGSMTAPNWNSADACLIGGEARGARLKWSFTDPDAGSFGSAYQIKVIRVSDSAEMLNTGKCTGYQVPDVKCKIDISCMNGGLTCTFPLDSVILPDYNTKYKWSVIVWDNGNMPSGETWYNSLTDTDNNDSDINTFTTYKHEFPDPYFVWSPSSPSMGEDTLFESQELAKYYTGDFSTKTGCDESNCNWAWTLGTGMTGNIVNPSGSTTIINLANMAVSDKEVYLTVTDNDGYACGTSTDMNINKKLPIWKETK